MAKSIDIQLTSRLGDDQWSWRAAGAREPKGVLSISIVPSGAKEGDVLKAEYERSIEGIEITTIAASTATKARVAKAETIELLGSGREQTGVSWSLAPKGKGRPKRDGDRGPRREGGRGPRSEGERGPRPDGERRPRPDGERGPRREGAGARGDSRRPERSDARGGRPGGGRQGPPVSTEYRNALLATLDPAQLSVAEQLLRGGLPAVRQAIAEQNSAARGAGQPAVAEDAILALAEALLPQTSLASWKDRAHSAQVAGKETRLRDLRAVVTASRSVSLDDEGKTMAKSLSENLTARVTGLSDEWVARITASLEAGKLAEALRLATRTPEPSTRLPAELASTLAAKASEGLSKDTDPREWLAILDAVVESPVRRNVKPSGIPPEADVEAAARKAVGHVPALAPLLGMKIPPPPPARRVVHRP